MADVDLTQLQSALSTVRQRVHEWKGQAELLRTQQTDHQGRKDELEAQGEVKVKALAVLQRLEETWRGKYEAALAALGSQGLSAVFTAGKYELLLESNIKRGVSNLDLVLVKDGQRVRLKGGSGGSVVQVLAYLLRHLMTTSHQPNLRHLEALDEPFSMVAAEQRPALCTMVKEITQRLGFQLLFSSHEDELLDAADMAYLVHPGGRIEQLKSSMEDRA
jgi:DNA repair exonuclease SbcCD ATPase subunit